MKSMNRLQWTGRFAALLCVAALAACGGGGGGGGGGGSGSGSGSSSSDGGSTTFGTKQLGRPLKATAGDSVATDNDGNVYVAGGTAGGLDGTDSTNLQDVFVTKYDNSGNKKFIRQLGVPHLAARGHSVATDRDGNVYVTGSTSGGLGTNIQTGSEDVFLIKYNRNGDLQFVKQLGVPNYTTIGYSVAIDKYGNIYVAGETNGQLEGNKLMSYYDSFVIKYDNNGNQKFIKQLGAATGYTSGRSVATDKDGNVYVAGYTLATNLGVTRIGDQDLFVAKYDTNGTLQFIRQRGVGNVSTAGLSVATDTSGNVYVTGYTNGALDSNTMAGKSDCFVTKYDSGGVWKFTKQMGAYRSYAIGNSVATDKYGNVYVAGTTEGGLGTNIQVGKEELFVTKYNSDGVVQFTKQMGVADMTKSTRGNSVAIDTFGNVYVAGETDGGLDGNALTGTSDFFLVSYNASGVKR